MSDDLQKTAEQNTGDTSASNDSASNGQSSDWEARFKGLQQKFNTLQSEHTTLKNEKAGLQGHATTLAQENQTLAQQLQDISTRTQADLTAALAAAQAAEAAKAPLETTIQELQAKNALLARDLEVRETMLTKGFTDLVPYLESKHLNLGDKTGDDLVAHLTAFRQMLKGQVDSETQRKLRGAAPVGVGVGGNDPSVEDHQTWLANHSPAHPEYDAHFEAYLAALEKQG